MNILFCKLRTYTSIKEDIESLEKRRDKEYYLDLYIQDTKFNPYQMLKDIESQINNEILVGEVYNFFVSNQEHRKEDLISYYHKFVEIIKVQFKYTDEYLLKEIIQYLLRLES